MTSRFLAVVMVLGMACGGGKGAPVPDVPGFDIAADVTDDTADIMLDAGPDLGLDGGLPDGEVSVPDGVLQPESFRVMEHPGCLPDGPHEVDRVRQVRTLDELPDPDAWAVLATSQNVLVGTGSGLYVGSPENLLFSKVQALAGTVFESARPVSLEMLPGGDYVVGCEVPELGFSVVVLDPELQILEGGPKPMFTKPLTTAFQCDGIYYAVVDGILIPMSDFAADQVVDVQTAACLGDEVWMAGPGGIRRLVGGPFTGQIVPVCTPPECLGFSYLHAGLDGIWAAGDGRLAKLSKEGLVKDWKAGLDGLPYDHFTALTLSDDGTQVAIGHDIGVTLLHVEAGTSEYFHSLRYLPGEVVRDLDFADDGSLWVATDGGLSRLWKEEINLQEKAELLFQKMEKWFFRLDGFLTANAMFDDPYEDDTSFLWDDDNDGQWTQEGVGALCYAYAVTGKEKYYQAARRCIENMMMLVDIPAISFEELGMVRGFVTRSVVRDDEEACFADKADRPNWHLVHWDDGHDYYWKDDTSSDEMTGHFYGFGIYYDLCAKDDQERSEIAEHVAAAGSYILDNGYKLIDLDGEPTTHGNWSPERLVIALDGLDVCVDNGHSFVECVDVWGGGGFLDSLEILSYLAASWHVTGEVRFLEALAEMAGPLRVGEAAMFTENVATWTGRGTTNYCDHELADLAFLTLLRYDPDADRRQQWVKSMLDAWEWEIEERNPLKALSMAAVLSEPPGLEAGIRSLVEYPDDLRQWRVDNSHRLDAESDVKDRHGDPQFKTSLPYDELPILRWDHNPYGMAGGGDGRARMSPAFWLLPYWGLRYHGAICE